MFACLETDAKFKFNRHHGITELYLSLVKQHVDQFCFFLLFKKSFDALHPGRLSFRCNALSFRRNALFIVFLVIFVLSLSRRLISVLGLSRRDAKQIANAAVACYMHATRMSVLGLSGRCFKTNTSVLSLFGRELRCRQ